MVKKAIMKLFRIVVRVMQAPLSVHQHIALDNECHGQHRVYQLEWENVSSLAKIVSMSVS